MSYPHELLTLIVEDDESPKSYYEAVFDEFAKRYPLATPQFAFCHEDGIRALESDSIFHLVILDLRLPRQPNQPAADELDFGLDLLARCANRNAYPIPAVLVISGYLDRANQSDLAARVHTGFAIGQVLIKGDKLDGEIESAIKKCLNYSQIGIHLRDGGTGVFPTLSPRDEDLLRRSVMSEECCLGVDLQWWSAECDPSVPNISGFAGWTKTLMGRFLLDKGRGKSRPTFFKLTPRGGAESVVAEAALLEHKLSHIKVFPPAFSGDRSLLVTQKVGDGDGAPTSLAQYLGHDPKEVVPVLPAVVRQIADQLSRLGDSSPDHWPVSKLLWPSHDRGRLESQWARWGGPQQSPHRGNTFHALETFAKLSRSKSALRIGVQTALHGDLNPTNVALDVNDNMAHGYIFDASGAARGLNLRDLATLEVTSLLHLPTDTAANIVGACAALYESDEVLVGEAPVGLDGRQLTTWTLISEIRRCAMGRAEATKAAYAITVFDHALIQLGGLAFTISRNKIRNPEQAAELAANTSHWLSLVCPEYLSG